MIDTYIHTGVWIGDTYIHHNYTHIIMDGWWTGGWEDGWVIDTYIHSYG